MKNEEKNQKAGPGQNPGSPAPGAPSSAAGLSAQTNSPNMRSVGASPGSNATTGSGTPPSSQSLAASEMSVGQGAVGSDQDQQPNREADPAAVREPARRGRKPGSPNKPKDGGAQPQAKAKGDDKPRRARTSSARAGQPDQYGGNFGNDMHDSFGDVNRRENQNSGASRGEFGVQAHNGATHAGYGNQYREFDYEDRHSAEDRYYGGPGRYGFQHNAYRDYDGRDERGQQPNYGGGYGPGPRDGYDDRGYGGREPRRGGYDDQPRGYGNYGDGRGNRTDNRNQPDRADRYSGHQNDNGSRPGRGGGYADDYGHSSLGGGRDQDYRRGPSPGPGSYGNYGGERRNQDEDYRSSRGGYDNQGSGRGYRDDEPQRGGYGSNRGGYPSEGYGNPGGPRSNSGEGYGYGHGRDEQPRRPDYRSGDSRNGYGRSYGGDSSQGFGSRGGSYNDEYDNGNRQGGSGSPSRGDYTRQDRGRNYGPGAQNQYRPGHPDEDDYGPLPRRNSGRDGEDRH